MARKQYKLTDIEILTSVDAKAKESIGWFDSKLSKERERVLQYYNGQLPKRQSIGSASYVSTDVYDAVESAKALLVETFAGGDEIAQFDPDQDMDVDLCIAATKYASYVIFQENDGFGVFSNMIQDGLMSRVGIAKVWWEEKYDYVEEDFRDLSLDDVYALSSQDDVDDFEANHNETTGMYDGHLVRKKDCSKVSITTVPPEEFIIAPRSVDLKSADYCAHRTLKTKAELKRMGYDAKKVDRINYDDAKGLDLSPEVLARNSVVETAQALDNPIQPDLEKIMLYESYVRMKLDDEKGVRLYRIVHASVAIFEKEEVDHAPFIPFTPLPIPHLFYGNNFAARVIPAQNARTVLTRAILDHASMTVNPRWQVVNGGLLNPREMLDNRQGGLVNVRRPDTVAPLQVPNLNPYVFELRQMISEDAEKSTGVSSLSQGLNKDAISKQNAQGLVDNLVSLSQQRAKIAAREFAYHFIVPLMIEVIRLVIMNEKKQKVIQVAGQPLNCSPQDWSERKTCTVALHLGNGEKDMAAQKHQNAYKALAEDPMLQNAFGLKQRIAMATDTMKLAGLSNAVKYLDQNAQPPQPDPLKVKELDIKDKLANASVMTAQAAVDKDKRLAAVDVSKLSLDQIKVHLDALMRDRDADRRDLETAAKITQSERELQIMESMPDSSRKAIVAPNP